MRKLFLFAVSALLFCGCCGNCEKKDGKLRLNVSLTVSPENRAALMDNLLQLAEASRAEDGCIGYEIYENSRDSSRVIIIETWESQSALDAHQQTEHFRLRAPLNGELASDSELLKMPF